MRNILSTTEADLTSFRSRSQVVAAASTIPGFAAAVQFDVNSVQRVANVPTPGTGRTFTLSIYVQLDDGLAPVVGAAAGRDFALRAEGITQPSATVDLVDGAL